MCDRHERQPRTKLQKMIVSYDDDRGDDDDIERQRRGGRTHCTELVAVARCSIRVCSYLRARFVDASTAAGHRPIE